MPVAEALVSSNGLHYAETIAETCRQAFLELTRVPKRGLSYRVRRRPFGFARAASQVSRRLGRTGMIWIDAHADLNTPQSSPSGNIHGMPLSHLLGQGDSRLLNIWGGGAVLRPQDLVFIGLRSLGPLRAGVYS